MIILQEHIRDKKCNPPLGTPLTRPSPLALPHYRDRTTVSITHGPLVLFTNFIWKGGVRNALVPAFHAWEGVVSLTKARTMGQGRNIRRQRQTQFCCDFPVWVSRLASKSKFSRRKAFIDIWSGPERYGSEAKSWISVEEGVCWSQGSGWEAWDYRRRRQEAQNELRTSAFKAGSGRSCWQRLSRNKSKAE